jgi:ATP-dependent protease Clp ATPase subunit
MVSTVQDYEVEVKEREALPDERTERPLRCSFCRLSHEQVDHLIGSPFNPEATICGACVMHALFLLDSRESEERRGNKQEMNPENRGLRCSFCNKPLVEVKCLVVSPVTTEVAICDECVAFAESLLDNSRASTRKGTHPR